MFVPSARVILPLGKCTKAANVPGGPPVEPVQLEHGEPGVRRGQELVTGHRPAVAARAQRPPGRGPPTRLEHAMNETLDAASTNPVPDYATAILGWRSWLVVRDRGEYRLRSLFFPAIWVPHRQLTGACERGPRRQRLRPWRREPPHDAPSLRCSCGVHSATRPETAVAYLRQVSTPPFDLVVGLVSLWGEIVECERGWRAEHAYPARLFLPSCGPGRRTDARALAAGLQAYGVPVEAVECMSPLDLAPALERRNVPGVAA